MTLKMGMHLTIIVGLNWCHVAKSLKVVLEMVKKMIKLIEIEVKIMQHLKIKK